MLAVGHNARNGRFREAFAAFIKDRSWPTPACQVTAAKRSFAILHGAYGLYSPRSFPLASLENYSTVTDFARFLG